MLRPSRIGHVTLMRTRVFDSYPPSQQSGRGCTFNLLAPRWRSQETSMSTNTSPNSFSSLRLGTIICESLIAGRLAMAKAPPIVRARDYATYDRKRDRVAGSVRHSNSSPHRHATRRPDGGGLRRQCWIRRHWALPYSNCDGATPMRDTRICGADPTCRPCRAYPLASPLQVERGLQGAHPWPVVCWRNRASMANRAVTMSYPKNRAPQVSWKNGGL